MSEQFRTGGSKIIENHVENGDLIFRVNKGGTKTDVLSISGASGTISSPSQPPVGAIVAYNPGYYTNAANAGFTLVGPATNNASGVNAYLPSDWRVCDGTALNDSASPIWNAAGRFLPNLTDFRFLMGSTAAGSTGGANTNSHTHTFTATGNNTGGAATFDKTVMNSSQTAHSHTLSNNGYAKIADDSSYIYYAQLGSVSSWTAGRRTAHSGNAADSGTFSEAVPLGGSTDTASVSWSSSTVTTSFTNPTFNGTLATTNTPNDTENRPLYLSTFYIVRVK